MRKNRLGAIDSYYQYQQAQERKQKCIMIGLMCLLWIGVAIKAGWFDPTMNTLFSMTNPNENKAYESIYLVQPKIDYSMYVAPEVAKGVYMPAGKLKNQDEVIELVQNTDVNSFVIDVKDDMGYLTFATENQMLVDKGIVLAKPPIEDMQKLINTLCEKNIYPIARIVTFKDSVVAKKEPERTVKKLDGSTYVTGSNDTWLNPYMKENWEYILEISKEAAKMGFKEIQLDYVRFHESMNSERVILDEDVSKSEIITEFTKYICENLKKEGVKVSADVFGAVILSDIDAEIVGQNFIEMSQYLDYICPMVYPSHYAEGTFGIEYPHLDPYELIYRTMKLGINKMAQGEGENKAVIRPWLQDFTIKSSLPYLKYGPEEVKAQIEGANDAGVKEWLFWNAAGNYTEDGLRAE